MRPFILRKCEGVLSTNQQGREEGRLHHQQCWSFCVPKNVDGRWTGASVSNQSSWTLSFDQSVDGKVESIKEGSENYQCGKCCTQVI